MDAKTTKRMIEQLSREDLIALVVKLSSRNEKAEGVLLEFCSQKQNSDNAELVGQKQVLHYWEVARKIINECNKYGETSYSNEEKVYKALDKLADVASNNELSWEFKKKLIDEMWDKYLSDYGCFEDVLSETLESLCQSREEKLYFADKLRKSSSEYDRKDAARIYLECGEDDTFLNLQTQNLSSGDDYIRLADYYRDQGQEDEALKFMEDALSKIRGWKDSAYQWLFKEYKKRKQEDKILKLYQTAIEEDDEDCLDELMYKYYQADYNKKKTYLLKLAKSCDPDNARKWYNECQKVLKEEDFEKEKEELRKALKESNPEAYVKLLFEEGRKDEVLECLKAGMRRNFGSGSLDFDHRFSKKLISEYPEEIARLYWMECEEICDSGYSKYYDRAVSILKEIKSIYGTYMSLELWDERFQAFLELFKKKYSLIERIDKAGLR